MNNLEKALRTHESTLKTIENGISFLVSMKSRKRNGEEIPFDAEELSKLLNSQKAKKREVIQKIVDIKIEIERTSFPSSRAWLRGKGIDGERMITGSNDQTFKLAGLLDGYGKQCFKHGKERKGLEMTDLILSKIEDTDNPDIKEFAEDLIKEIQNL